MIKAFSDFMQKRFSWVFNTFKDDNSKMLIITGTAGWILSSIAQVAGIYANSKISPEQKSFLVPQELMDGAINALTFIGITTIAKKGIAKMASTGKVATESVRKYINRHPEFKDKVGKYDFNLDKVIPHNIEAYESYNTYKNFITTMGTLGASVLSCNIVTPLIRNATASKVQKTYIERKNNPSAYAYQNSGNMKV